MDFSNRQTSQIGRSMRSASFNFLYWTFFPPRLVLGGRCEGNAFSAMLATSALMRFSSAVHGSPVQWIYSRGGRAPFSHADNLRAILLGCGLARLGIDASHNYTRRSPHRQDEGLPVGIGFWHETSKARLRWGWFAGSFCFGLRVFRVVIGQCFVGFMPKRVGFRRSMWPLQRFNQLPNFAGRHDGGSGGCGRWLVRVFTHSLRYLAKKIMRAWRFLLRRRRCSSFRHNRQPLVPSG